MPNYKESAVTGTRWTRAVSVVCQNPLAGQREVVFVEEQVLSLGETSMSLGQTGACNVVFSEAGSFPLLDPETGEPTGGTMTHADLYAALFSLYIAAALARDEAAAAAAAAALAGPGPT